MNEEILNYLNQHRDEKYADFQRKLIPNIPPESIIGVRTPLLRSYAKELSKSVGCGDFTGALPHAFFEENQLHALVLSEIKDFGRCVKLTELFLPYIDNWATCDQLSPKVFKKHTDELLPYIRRWLASPETYTVRFGLDMLMRFYLDENFSVEYAELAAAVRSEEYYVNMAAAWYFATALAKHYDEVLPYIAEGRLTKWVHNKTIQKAIESYRITDEQKAQLRGMKI